MLALLCEHLYSKARTDIMSSNSQPPFIPYSYLDIFGIFCSFLQNPGYIFLSTVTIMGIILSWISCRIRGFKI